MGYYASTVPVRGLQEFSKIPAGAANSVDIEEARGWRRVALVDDEMSQRIVAVTVKRTDLNGACVLHPKWKDFDVSHEPIN